MKKILLIGGRGFLGQHLLSQLENQTNYEIYTFDTAPGNEQHRRGNLLEIDDLLVASRDIDILVNLVGLTPLRQPKGLTYHQIHVQGVKNILEAAQKNHIKKIIHISALGANEKSLNSYLRTKGQGQKLLLDSSFDVTVFAPSLMYAQEGVLMDLLWGNVIPLLPATFSPIHVDDVARYIVLAIKGTITQRHLELGGPEDLTLWQMASRVKRFHLPLPFFIVKKVVKVAADFSLFGMSQDQLQSLSLKNTLHDVRCFDYFKPRRFMSEEK